MIYSKRRKNLGRSSNKRSNQKLKLIGGSSSSVKSCNDNKPLDGYSPVKVATWYPQGTKILKTDKEGEQLPIITLDTKRILHLNDLGDRIIGVKKPEVIPSSKHLKGKKQVAINNQKQLKEQEETIKRNRRWNRLKKELYSEKL